MADVRRITSQPDVRKITARPNFDRFTTGAVSGTPAPPNSAFVLATSDPALIDAHPEHEWLMIDDSGCIVLDGGDASTC